MAGYGGKHLKGYTTVKASMIPRKKVRKRNFIETAKTSNDKLAKDMNDALIMQAPIVLKVGKR